MLFSLVSVDAAATAAAGPLADVYSYLEDPERVAEGQEAPHAVLRPYLAAAAARAGADETPWTRSLDGAWRIKMADRPEDVPTRFWADGYDTSRWQTVQVPHSWITDGLDHPMFRNIATDMYPDAPPAVPHDVNPTGAYVRTFDLPAAWRDRRTFVRFEGVTSAYFLWVNGQYVGYDQGGYVPAEFDLTDHLRAGRNTIAVQVHRWSAGSHLENYDQWRFAGIFRSTWLYSTPQTHLRDVTITAPLDASHTNATLNAKVEVAGQGDRSVRATLYDPAGREITTVQGPVAADGTAMLSTRVTDPAKWTDETPNLYSLIVELIAPGGAVTHVTRQPVGFRSVEVRDKQIQINGKRLLVRGVNRSDTDLDNGRHVPRSRILQDVKLMKQLNVNAVRTAHYPSDPYFYDLADRYGVWIDDEVEVETHHHDGCPDNCLAERPEWQKAFLDRYVGMIQRDKNHPSVFMWGTGNEAGLGQAHYAMAEWTKANAPGRLLYHQSNGPDGDAPYADVWGPRYPSPGSLAEKAKTTTKPIVMGEYAHAQGNSLGNIREFWDVVRRYPQVQGGFVWDWVDQQLRQPLRTTPDASGNDILAWLSGRPEVVDGKRGKALYLSGLDDIVEVYRDRRLDQVSDRLTLDAWIRPARWTGDFTVIAKGDHQYSLKMANENTLEFFVHGGGGYRTVRATVPADWYGNWHRVSGTFDGTRLALFIDGAEAGHLDWSGTVDASHYPVNIGRDPERMTENTGRMAHGTVDQVRIYHQALTPAQLAADPKGDAVLALDFDTVEQRGTYLSYGAGQAGNDGLIMPDRTPQPEAYAMAAAQAPIRFAAVDAEAGIFTVRSERSFAGTNDLELSWQLDEMGSPLARGSRPLVLPAGGEATVRLPRARPNPLGAERMLTVRAVLKKATSWAPAGHVVALDQFQAGGRQITGVGSPAGHGPVTTNQAGDQVVVAGPGFRYAIDRDTGTLTSMRVRGTELLNGGPRLDAWRAPVSNENWGEANDWRAVGLDRLRTMVDSVRVAESRGQVVVTVGSTVAAPGVTDASFKQAMTYTITANGDIRLGHRVDPRGRMRTLPYLPRVGLQLGIKPQLERFTWYGRGPHENYNDRKDGATVDVYRSTVDDQYVEYYSPQDYGNHDDVRWAILSDGRGAGLLVAGDLEVGVTPYDDAERAAYPFALQRNAGWNTLHVDHAVSGVSETFHTVLPQYQVRGDRQYDYTVLLRPLTAAEAGAGVPAGPRVCGPTASLAAAKTGLEPGESTTATLTVTNDCPQPATGVAATLRTPNGWTVTPAAAQSGRIAPRGSASVEVTVSRGADTPTGEESLVADVTSTTRGVPVFATTALTLVGTPRAPRGEARVSSLEFLQAENGWGPVERDLSNGEQAGGDGRQLAVGGQTYEHGLGVHAESLVSVFAGERCTSFTAEVGVDDETGEAGSLIFEVYADDRLVATSPRLTGTDGARPIQANVTGASTVKLRATEAADGNAWDHGDWANAILHCAT